MNAETPPTREDLLGRLPLFSGTNSETIARLARSCRPLQVGKGDILFNKGDICHGFHVIVAGQIKLAFTSAQGTEKVVEILATGESVGESLMFLDQPYMLFAQALSDTQLLHVPKSIVFAELERDLGLCRRMLAGMAMRLHQLIQDVESYSLLSGKQRIIDYLLRYLPAQDAPQENITVSLPTNKGVIASRLNLTQEHFSRILHELSAQGLIVVEGRKIHLPRLGELRGQLA